MAHDGVSENCFFPPSDDLGRPGSELEPPYFTDRRGGGKSPDDLYDSESATPDNSEEEDYENVGTGRRELYNVSNQPKST